MIIPEFLRDHYDIFYLVYDEYNFHQKSDGWKSHPWMEKPNPWMEKCHPWMERCHSWMSSMDGEISSMNESVIRGCHQWMTLTSADEDDR